MNVGAFIESFSVVRIVYVLYVFFFSVLDTVVFLFFILFYSIFFFYAMFFLYCDCILWNESWNELFSCIDCCLFLNETSTCMRQLVIFHVFIFLVVIYCLFVFKYAHFKFINNHL